MSDQQTSPETETPTAAVDSPEGIDQQQTQAPQQDWERDYKELQREFTRTRQQMTDPEYQAQRAQEWLSQNGYALPDDEEPEEFDDPSDALAQRLEQLEAQVASRTEQEQRAQQIAELETRTEQQLAQIQDLDEGDKDWIVSRAIALPPTEDGGLDVHKAYQELVARDQAAQKRWAATKQRAPFVPPGGRPANEVPDLSSHEGRVNNMLRLLHERE